jgi:hypothetical protein
MGYEKKVDSVYNSVWIKNPSDKKQATVPSKMESRPCLRRGDNLARE